MISKTFITETGLNFKGMQRIYLSRLADMINQEKEIQLRPSAAEKLGKPGVKLQKKYAKIFQHAFKNAPKSSTSNYVDLSAYPQLKVMQSVDGVPVPFSAIEKSNEIKGVSIGKAKAYNLGNIGEIALGVAAGARFIKLGQAVEINDFLKLAANMSYYNPKSAKGKALDSIYFTYQTSVKHKIGKIDTLEILIRANSNSSRSFIGWLEKPDTIPAEVAGAILSAIHYVNQNAKMTNGIEKTARDKNTNKVKVTSDGISDASGTKADLYLSIDQERVNILSVKTSKSQLGQASGSNFQNQVKFFKNVFDIDASKYQKFWGKTVPEHVVAATRIWKDLAIPKCAGLVAGNNTNKEKQLIKMIVNGLIRYSNDYDPTTGQIDFIDIVKLGKNPASPGYKLMRIDYKLTEALERVDMMATVPPSGAGINIYGKVTRIAKNGNAIVKNVPLCRMWSGPSGLTFRTAVEGGDLLDELAEVADEIEQQKQQVKATTKAKSKSPAQTSQIQKLAVLAPPKAPTVKVPTQPEIMVPNNRQRRTTATQPTRARR